MSKESIYQLVNDSVLSLKFILLECITSYGKTKDTLKIVIHHLEKKITSDDCTLVANIISRQLDIGDPFERPYDLIVESPGLEYEFKSYIEYQFFIGKEIKIFISDNKQIITKEGFLIGVLLTVHDDSLTIQTASDTLKIPFEYIKKSKLYCDYNKLLKK